jgi:hypothetical protein
MKKTGAGQVSRCPSRRPIADPISPRLDVRMAPKYHRTPLSGGDRKALAKEPGKARAMANSPRVAVNGDASQGRGTDPTGRQTALRKLERADVVGRGAAATSNAYWSPCFTTRCRCPSPCGI